MEAWWKSWVDVANLSKNKRVVLYGRSEDWIPKTLKKISVVPDYIVDRNPVYHETKYNNIQVVPPEHLLSDDNDDIYIIITSGVYEGIISFLVENGFEAGRDFCCSPEYQDFYLLEEMRNYEKNIIVSCSDYHDNTMTRYSRAGGGIYNYHVGPNTVERLVKGSFRQIVETKSCIYAVEFVECQLYIFDKQFKVLDKKLLDGANYCGIDYDPVRDLIVLISAKNDTISLYKASDFSLVEKVAFSDKNTRDGVTSQHHLNDVCIDGDYIYVSYFSYSGNWKKNIHDGGVSEFHIDRLSEGSVQVIKDLWKPHSPKVINGELCYLDSMRGGFYTGNQTVSGEFHGFARGLTFDGRFYYIGQSEDMYMSKRFNVSNNIMLNAGFYLFDLETKASRFYPMLDNMNIHDLMILEGS